MPLPLPAGFRVERDRSTRVSRRARSLLGGTPLRLLRLSQGGAALVDRWFAGEPVGPEESEGLLARRLVDAGIAQPVPPSGSARVDRLTSGTVVPVRDSVLSVPIGAWPGPVVVVDDGSDEPITAAGHVQLLRHTLPAGPGAARNTGWAALDTALVAFVDADVRVEPDWLDALVPHFADPAVGAVAPRVVSSGGGGALGRYESVRSPLDLGAERSVVAPRRRVPYVPTAALVVRRDALAEVGGFDEALKVGEDVDLLWRLVRAGWTVRYEPSAVVAHEPRRSWCALAAQRRAYGSSAAELAERHPGAVAPVELDAWSLLSWLLLGLGNRRLRWLGAATASVTAAGLWPRLAGRVDRPTVEAARLGGLGHLWAGQWLADAVRRAWLPPLLAGALVSGRLRRLLAVVAVGPPLVEWCRVRPPLDPLRWLAARALDDSAYCLGVWQGCFEQRSWEALLPRLSGIPGLTRSRSER